MFNSIRKSHVVDETKFVPSPQYEFQVAHIEGDSALQVPLDRSLVDNRVKVSSVSATQLAANGVKPGRVSIGAPLEDSLKAMSMLKKIVSDAEYRASVEQSIAEFEKSSETFTEKPVEKPVETSSNQE